jgi:hypothetical protein
MGLTSNLLKGDAKLEACAVSDPAHVYQGQSGAHVGKIQEALKQTDGAVVNASELASQTYGPSTANAVLKFKQNPKRNIKTFRGQFDNIVGKKTIAALDTEMFVIEHGTPPPPPPVDPDMALVNAAESQRLSALRKAIEEVTKLKNIFEPNPPDQDDPVVQALQRQLFLSPDSNFWITVNTFLAHMVNNSMKRASFLINKSDPNFAHVDPSNLPSKGVTIGASFFAPGTTDNCRQEVVTHEFFHYVVGLQHFYSTHETGEAMRCPHHLARAVFDIAIGQQKAPCGVDIVCR